MSAPSSPTRIFVSDRCFLPAVSASSFTPAAIVVSVSTGRVTAIQTQPEEIAAIRSTGSNDNFELIDGGNDILMSGLVDTHVHCNEPGRTDWEGLETATKAAAAGGVTTIVPSNLNDLKELAAGGVCGFKCFMIESGVDEFPCVSTDELRSAMKEVVNSCPTLPVLCHAEACGAHDHPTEEGKPNEYHSYLHSRPTRFETDAIRTALSLAEETGARTHVVHLSAAEGVSLFSDARARGLKNVSVETCPHYLTLDAESIPSGATAFKCAPPIRGKANQAQLWQALRDGHINMIVSDHSPCEPSLKLLEAGDFSKAWGGISSLQLGLPLIFSELRAQALESGSSEDAATLSAVSQVNLWMSVRTSEFVHFHHRKGAIKVGNDADLTFFSPDTPFLVEKSMIQHRHKLTPYLGRTLHGLVRHTIVRGQSVYGYQDGATPKFAHEPIGQRIRPAEHPMEKRE